MRALLLAATALTACAATQAAAQSVQIWTGNGNNVFGNNANWSAGPAPGSGDTARFDGVTGNANAIRALTLGAADATVRQIDVVSGAGAYSLTTAGNRLDIGQAVSGGISIAAGSSFTIANNGGGVVAFDNASVISGNLIINNTGGGSGIDFFNGSNAGTAAINLGAGTNAAFRQTSSAGSSTITANNNSLLFFFDDSRAGSSTIVSNGFSLVEFRGNADAQNANITINGGAGTIRFWENATAGSSNITINNGAVSFGQTGSGDTATAANATINVNGGALVFEGDTTAGNATVFVSSAAFGVGFGDNATGGNARFVLATDGFGGLVDFSFSAGAGGLGVMTAGSIEGGGEIRIGGPHGLFRVGSNNLSTEFSGLICECGGPAGLEKVGTGTLILSGNNTYTGGTTITGGTLQIGNGGATGSVLGNIVNNSVLALNRSDDIDFTNNISGTGALNHTGTGITTLIGANTYTGATNVVAGTLRAGGVNAFGAGSAVTVITGATLSLNNFDQTVGSLAGGGGIALGTATLTLGNNNLSTNMSGVISGTGGIVKNGTGTLTLDGINTYTGATVINSGGLIVNGSIATSQQLTINNGVFLGGSGILPSTTINGGTLAPGNSIGTITVQGNLTIAAGSTYVVELDATASDRTNVSGVATVAGNVILVPESSLVPRTYTILHADGGLSGVFTGLDRSLIPATFRVSLTHTANDVLLTLAANLSAFGLNRNQVAVATGIDNAANAGAALNSGFAALFNLPTAAIPGALTQLSGEVATGASSAGLQLMNQYLSLLLNPFAEQRSGGAFGPAQGFAAAEPLPREIADAYAAVMPVKAAPPGAAQRWSVWGAAYGGANTTRGDGVVTGSHDITPRGYGFAVGADYRAAPGTLVGFSIAGGGTSWALGAGLGSGRSDVFQAGVYASRQFGAAYVSAALAGAWHEGSTDRTVSVSGVDRLRGDFNAASIGARLEGGYRFALRMGGLTPYAAVQAQGFRNNSFGETASSGSAQFALNYGAVTANTVRAELGAWADSRLALAGGHVLALRGRLAWAHDEGDGARIGATFQGLPGASFTVLGAAAPSNLALAGAGAELRLRNNLSLGAKFDGEFASRSRTYSGAGTVRYVW